MGILKGSNVAVRAWSVFEESIIITTVLPKARFFMRIQILKDFGHNFICLKDIIGKINLFLNHSGMQLFLQHMSMHPTRKCNGWSYSTESEVIVSRFVSLSKYLTSLCFLVVK